MYIPPYFRESDRTTIRQLMVENEFATVVSYGAGRPIASHLPIELRDDSPSFDRLILAGHMARTNPLWETFGADREALVIFLGAHTYISSTWYAAPAVPTWNYSAVHAYGRPRIIDDPEELYRLLARLVDRHERRNRSVKPLALADLPAGEVKQMMQGIVGFEIAVTEVQAAAKLSQNRSDEDFAAIGIELRKRSDESSHRVAEAMARLGRAAARKNREEA